MGSVYKVWVEGVAPSWGNRFCRSTGIYCMVGRNVLPALREEWTDDIRGLLIG